MDQYSISSQQTCFYQKYFSHKPVVDRTKGKWCTSFYTTACTCLFQVIESLHFQTRKLPVHLDEVLTDMDKRGVNGPAKTRCAIVYTEAAKGCTHLVWDKNVLHFTYFEESCEMTIDKFVFDPIFQIAKKMYTEQISHKTFAEQKNYSCHIAEQGCYPTKKFLAICVC